MKLRELAERLECRLEGDGGLEIRGVAGLEQAGEGDVAFFANPQICTGAQAHARLGGHHRRRRAGGALRDAADEASLSRLCECAVRVRDARASARPASISSALLRTTRRSDTTCRSVRSLRSGAARASAIARSSIRTSVIGDGAVVGDDCVIHSHAAIRERVMLGNRVVIQNGAVIGGDGYGFVRRPDGTHQKIPQTSDRRHRRRCGDWREHDDRSAGGRRDAHSGRAPRSTTSFRSGTASASGRNTLLAAQVGIAGSTSIGDDVTLAGQVGVAGHVTIGKGASAVGQSGHHQFGARRGIRVGLSGDREQGMAEIVRDFQEAARAAEEDCRARTACPRARGGARRDPS